MVSNVYPATVHDGAIPLFAEENRAFLARILDRRALRKLIEMRFGRLNDDRLMGQYADTMPGLSKWQARRITLSDGCAYAEPDEKPWGVTLHKGEFREVCKCRRRRCQHFSECRPEEPRNAQP